MRNTHVSQLGCGMTKYMSSSDGSAVEQYAKLKDVIDHFIHKL